MTFGDIINPISFDEIKLNDGAYNFDSGITIEDGQSVVDDILNRDALTGVQKSAADVNNDGDVNISDVVAILRQMNGLESIDTFDLVDENGNTVTEITSDNSGKSFNLIANGDIDGSGGFNADYLVTDTSGVI